MLVNLIQDIHNSTKRDYSERMNKFKPTYSSIARKFDKAFFDGDRKYGYGGFKDDGRWKKLSKRLIDRYKIKPESEILDIGCGKGFLARDIETLSNCNAWGCDISKYAIDNNVLGNTFLFNAGKDNLDDIDSRFDLIISINTLHNLVLPNLKQAIQQINTHSKNAYIVVESYRNVQELYNLQCWALTCEQFFRPEEWEFLFKEWGYSGDWEFIFFR